MSEYVLFGISIRLPNPAESMLGVESPIRRRNRSHSPTQTSANDLEQSGGATLLLHIPGSPGNMSRSYRNSIRK